MIPQEITENSARISRTPLEIGLERRIRPTIPAVGLSSGLPPCTCRSRANRELPSVRKHSSGTYRAPLGQRDFKTVSRYERAVKPMLRLEFSRFQHAPFPPDQPPRCSRLGRGGARTR